MKVPLRRGRFLLPALLLLLPCPFRAFPDFYGQAPEPLSPGEGKFPVTASNGSLAVAAWQETVPLPGASGGIALSLAVKDGPDAGPQEGWRVHRFVGGPYPFFGPEPPLLSAAVDGRDRIILAAAASAAETELFISDDRGESFRRIRLDFGSEGSVAPRIFSRDGGYYLFITRGKAYPGGNPPEYSLDLYYAFSADGLSWPPFQPLIRDDSLRFKASPAYASLGGVDYVVFQSLVEEPGREAAFHLFLSSSSDLGQSWTPPRRLTGAAGDGGTDNQRPSLSIHEGRLHLVWERRRGSGPPEIAGAFIPSDGGRGKGAAYTPIDRISAAGRPGHNPIAFSFRGDPAAVWFDGSRGFAARRSGGEWRDLELPAAAASGAAVFVRPAAAPDGLSLLWQAADPWGIDRIYLFRPRITEGEGPPEPEEGILEPFGADQGPDTPWASWRETAPGQSPLFVMAGLVLFGSLGLISTARGLSSVFSESALLRLAAAALVGGGPMPLEKKKQVRRIRKRGGGLRLKLASFTIALVLLVVVMASVPLYYRMTRTLRETLLQGLWDRCGVLLEGIASNARVFLPSRDVLELGFLPAQSAAIPEARYVTITGYGPDSSRFDDRVWATNDPDILSKIDSPSFQPGISRLQDALSPRLEGLVRELDSKAQAEAGEISIRLAELTREGVSLALNGAAGPSFGAEGDLRRMEEIQAEARVLEAKLSERLAALSREPGSEPAFPQGALSPEGPEGQIPSSYIFFKPILYRQGSEDTFFRGLIRLEVSLDSIAGKIAEGQRLLLGLILAVGLSALGIGALGALALSTLIIRPIRRLASHVELIRDTEDKADLVGADIEIKSRDEIALLGNTINDMTRHLIQAAQTSRELSIGKEIQKKFLPLQVNREGNKLNFGYQDSSRLSFFGYYQGAKGVSGDYFDYRDLDGRYFAVIKCDVAGKGVPAALIMIQVATLFRTYFNSWKAGEGDMHIEEAVYQINEFIETLAFEGTFAAFTLCLFDSQTGIARFCNAGDNLVRWYDASEGAMKSFTFREAPAAGVLPNALIASKGGYTVQIMTFESGDILFLYTDGIEEAKRQFRSCKPGEIPERPAPGEAEEGGDLPQENPTAGRGDEELGSARVTDIINAVMNRRRYTLHRRHTSEGDHAFQFDFTGCETGVEEAVMALVSVEKIFRSYRSPTGESPDHRPGGSQPDLLPVDKKIDQFLRAHFLQYRDYCHPLEIPGNEDFFYYTGLREDDQYDDITILGVKRK